MAALTVTVGRPFLCMISGCSDPYSSVTSAASGTTRPSARFSCMLRIEASDWRSSATPRATTSIRKMSSRSCVTLVPLNRADRAWAMSWLVTLSRRAWSWSTTRRTMRAGSFQSSAMSRRRGSEAISVARPWAASRAASVSGLVTRYWTGLPTGGPISRFLT